jgi:hypothetical protein
MQHGQEKADATLARSNHHNTRHFFTKQDCPMPYIRTTSINTCLVYNGLTVWPSFFSESCGKVMNAARHTRHEQGRCASPEAHLLRKKSTDHDGSEIWKVGQ